MKNNFHFLYALILAAALLGLQACQNAEGNQTGSEFIPDMAHSIAYEPNVYGAYSLNTFEKESEVARKSLTAAKLPVKGTIPRGYAGQFLDAEATAYSDHGIEVPMNGHAPYYYENSEEGRAKAMEELVMNPYPITAEGLAKGKELYVIFCGICHGEKGDGLGYLVRDDGGKYPAAPANFLLDEHVNATNGRYYHAIMYGRNAMGAYADKLSYEERWDVIHYIRSLQAKDRKLEYSADANTLDEMAVPASDVVQNTPPMPEEPAAEPEESGSHSTDDQNGGH